MFQLKAETPLPEKWSVWVTLYPDEFPMQDVYAATLETVGDFFDFFGPAEWDKLQGGCFSVMRGDTKPQLSIMAENRVFIGGYDIFDPLARRVIDRLLYLLVTGQLNETGKLVGVCVKLLGDLRFYLLYESQTDKYPLIARKLREIDIDVTAEELEPYRYSAYE